MKTGIELLHRLDTLLQDEDLDPSKMKEAFEGLLPSISDYMNGVGPGRIEGASLILRERMEQVEKHGWDVKNDADYSENELIKAALFCIAPMTFEWPYFWGEEFREKIILKNRIDQLKVAGAFIAAQMDRLLYEESKITCECGNSHPLVAEFGKCGKCMEMDLPD